MSDFEPPEKRQRMAESGELSAVLLVPSQLMPGLVGKGGNNVRQLEQASGARINCEKTDRGDDRGVEVSGSSANIAEAVRHISEMICNALNLSTTTIKMAVAAAIAPKLVGKQGSCIKQMIATSGANIVIERASDSGPSYSESTRTVTISGSTDSVATAVMLIVEKIDDLERTSGPSRRPSERDYDRRDRPPPPYNFDAPPARDWYGPPMDGGGDRGWGMGGSAGGGMEPYSYSAPQAAYGFDEPRGGGGDYRDGGGYYPPHRDPPPQYVPPRHAAPPVRGDAPVAGAGAGRETTLTIRVPAKFAGQVSRANTRKERAAGHTTQKPSRLGHGYGSRLSGSRLWSRSLSSH
jgi:hypothetical protein